jgi:hypothetical protein
MCGIRHKRHGPVGRSGTGTPARAWTGWSSAVERASETTAPTLATDEIQVSHLVTPANDGLGRSVGSNRSRHSPWQCRPSNATRMG